MSLRFGFAVIAAACAVTAFPTRTLAAVDSFIWFDSPSMQGETKDKAHPGAFEIKDFSFGVEHPTAIGSAAGGAGAGKVKFNEFNIKRVVDSASPKFHQAAASGQHFPTVKVVARKAGGGQKEFLTYNFSNVVVTKVSWSGPGDEGPEESISFSYGALKTDYKEQTSQSGQQRQTFAPAGGLPPPGPGPRPPH